MADTRCECCGRPVTGELSYVRCTVAVLCDRCSKTYKLVAVRKYPTPWDGKDLQPGYYPPSVDPDMYPPPSLDQPWAPPIPVTC